MDSKFLKCEIYLLIKFVICFPQILICMLKVMKNFDFNFNLYLLFSTIPPSQQKSSQQKKLKVSQSNFNQFLS